MRLTVSPRSRTFLGVNKKIFIPAMPALEKKRLYRVINSRILNSVTASKEWSRMTFFLPFQRECGCLHWQRTGNVASCLGSSTGNYLLPQTPLISMVWAFCNTLRRQSSSNDWLEADSGRLQTKPWCPLPAKFSLPKHFRLMVQHGTISAIPKRI